MEAQDLWQLAAWWMLHAAGIGSAWGSRLRLGRRTEYANHLVLAASFLLIACLAMLHLATGYQLSLLSATTLAAMAVGAVCDCRSDDENRVLTRVVAAYE